MQNAVGTLVWLMFCGNLYTVHSQVSGQTKLCLGSKLHLWTELDSIIAWVDSKDSTTVLSTEKWLYASPEESTTILLYTASDTIETFVYVWSDSCNCNHYVPNIFTPDGDGFNQYFFPVIYCDILGVHMTIYNRDQKIVFDAQGFNPKWDGTNQFTGETCLAGAYVYQISYMKSSGEIIRLVGHVVLAYL